MDVRTSSDVIDNANALALPVSYANLLGGLVGTMSLCHGVMPMTMDDTFALVPHHTIFSPIASLPFPFVWNLVTAHLFEASILRGIAMTLAVVWVVQRLERLWHGARFFPPANSDRFGPKPREMDRVRFLLHQAAPSGRIQSSTLLQLLQGLQAGDTDDELLRVVLDGSSVDLQEFLRGTGASAATELRIWLGFVKLDDKIPTVHSIERLLFTGEGGTADGADVLALFLTDLITCPRSLDVSLQLEEGLVFNEDDPALLIRQIPAQLVKADEDGLRHVSMHVAVKCKYVRDFDNDASINHHDCFPETLSLTCKSARKNEFEPSFKAILKQEVLLHVDGSDVDLMLLEEVVCLDSLQYVNMELLMNDVRGTYFGWADGHAFQHGIAEDDGCTNLYLQLGWPDGVGLSKCSTISGDIVHWQSEWNLRAQYHLPMRSMVMLHVGQGTTLKVWLGFVKVNRKLPTIDSLHELLYGDMACSVLKCDVIALYLTDVCIAPDDVQNFRCLLRRAMNTSEANEYVFNEDDPSLLIRQIPAQLVKSAGDGLRYVSMHVAVSRRLVKESENDASSNHHDCFPETLSLTCKSARKNEFEPSFKAILKQEVLLHVDGSDVDLMLLGANLDTDDESKNEFEPSFKAILKQEVLLHVDGSDVDLMLLGANLDTDDESKLGQLQALERMLNVSKRGSQKFAALIWGDFNNRLVAFEDMKGYVSEKKGKFELTESGARFLVDCFTDPAKRLELLKKDSLTGYVSEKKGKFELTESGARFLVDCFTDPAKRLELLKKDSLTYSGRDLRGEIYTRSECSSKMKDMFWLTIDAALDSRLEVPWPFYRVEPFEAMLGAQLGCRLTLLDLVSFSRLGDVSQHWAGRRGGSASNDGGGAEALHTELLSAYFNWKEDGKWLQRKIKTEASDKDSGRHFFQFGWLDSVGWYRHNTVQIALASYETVPDIQAYDHLPMIATMKVTA
eukprot:s6995_g4.t1